MEFSTYQFGVNYETSSHYPIKGTQELIIK